MKFCKSWGHCLPNSQRSSLQTSNNVVACHGDLFLRHSGVRVEPPRSNSSRHVKDTDHINVVRSNVINDSIRMLEHFADLAYPELWHDTPGKREDANLFAATGQPINRALGVGG